MSVSGTLTPERFRDLALRKFVIRALMSEKIDRHGEEYMETTILLHTTSVDENTNHIRKGLKYEYRDPNASYDVAVGLEDITVEDTDFYLSGLINEWENSILPWSSSDDIVVCRRSRDGLLTRVDTNDRDFRENLVRFQTRVAYEIVIKKQTLPGREAKRLGVHSGWSLSGIFYGLGNLIRRLDQVAAGA